MAFGGPEKQAVVVAETLYDAFEDKFKKLFGSKEKSIPVIAGHLRNDRIVVTFHEDTIVGVGGLKFDGKGPIDINFWQLLQSLKWGIFRFLVFHWVFDNEVEQNEILVDMLAVTCTMRGKGIGKELMNFIIDFAHSRGYEQGKLFVIDTNVKAKTFYERIGFKEKGMHSFMFPWNRIVGFNEAFEMVYKAP